MRIRLSEVRRLVREALSADADALAAAEESVGMFPPGFTVTMRHRGARRSELVIIVRETPETVVDDDDAISRMERRGHPGTRVPAVVVDEIDHVLVDELGYEPGASHPALARELVQASWHRGTVDATLTRPHVMHDYDVESGALDGFITLLLAFSETR